jgi:hypothetical protein
VKADRLEPEYLYLKEEGTNRLAPELAGMPLKRRTKNAKAFHDKCENG